MRFGFDPDFPLFFYIYLLKAVNELQFKDVFVSQVLNNIEYFRVSFESTSCHVDGEVDSTLKQDN